VRSRPHAAYRGRAEGHDLRLFAIFEFAPVATALLLERSVELAHHHRSELLQALGADPGDDIGIHVQRVA
jgi:hypothetical protein